MTIHKHLDPFDPGHVLPREATEKTTPAGTVASVYDIANRLSSVESVPYTWDDNGNLLSDGQQTYTYNRANRLTSVTEGTNTTSFSYNGLGDRMQETVNGVTTTFALDLNTGLTQVLSDGINTYLYGNGRIGQFTGADSAYFLDDALGSVRQLVDGNGKVTLTKEYEPYGEVMSSAGSGSSSYGYISEWAEANFIYLRARIYSALIGKFTSRDSWEGNLFTPASYNQWLYGYSNPITFVDHTGNQALCTEPDCDILEDENKKNWTEIAYGLKFTADSGASWSTRNRLETIKGVVAVAKKMAELVMEKGNYSIKPSELYKKVFKDDLVTFHWLTNAGAYCERRWPQQGVEAGVQCYNNNNVTAVQMAHELGHVFNAAIENKISRGEILRTTVSPYDLLTSKGISYLEEKDGNCEIEWFANYQSSVGRTFTGMQEIHLQNLTPTSNEDFADMFAHWNFNYFLSDDPGKARKRWMDKNMTLWLYRILYPKN